MYAGDRLFVGVTRGNVDRLTAGQPMRVALMDHKAVREIVVLFGEDKPAILAQVEAAGMEIPQAVKDSAAADPS